MNERRLYQLPWHASFERRWGRDFEDVVFNLPPAKAFLGDGIFAVQLALGELRAMAIVGDWPAIPPEWRLDACRARRAAGKTSVGDQPIP